jgi:hypothetical protein
MIKVSEILNTTEYNFMKETRNGNYEERMKELKIKINEMVSNRTFHSSESKRYGIYFSDLFFGNKEESIQPVFIKVPLSPLGIDILVGYFQNIADEIDSGTSLSEDFIVNLLVKYYDGEKILKEEIEPPLDNILYIGLYHNWEYTVCCFYDEIDKLEKNPSIVSDIANYISKCR